MRGEFSVKFSRKKVHVERGVAIVKCPELAEVIMARAQSPAFTLDVSIWEWNNDDIKSAAQFKMTGLARSAYKVKDRQEIHISVPELVDLVSAHGRKRSFALELHVADEGWLSPPAKLTRS